MKATQTTGEFVTVAMSEGRLSNHQAMNLIERHEVKDLGWWKRSSFFNWLTAIAVLAVLFFATQVFAQVAQVDGGITAADVTMAVVEAPSPVLDGHKLVADIVLGVAALLMTLLTTVVLPALRKWAQSKAEGEQATAATKVLVTVGLKVEGFITAGLAKVWGTFEADMKKAAHPSSDGGSKITAAELAAAREHVLQEVKNYLGTAGLDELKGVFGFGGDLLDNFLRSKIDEKIQAAKQAGSLAAAQVSSGNSAAAVLNAL